MKGTTGLASQPGAHQLRTLFKKPTGLALLVDAESVSLFMLHCTWHSFSLPIWSTAWESCFSRHSFSLHTCVAAWVRELLLSRNRSDFTVAAGTWTASIEISCFQNGLFSVTSSSILVGAQMALSFASFSSPATVGVFFTNLVSFYSWSLIK